jgi:cbb3-type cytochrome oxidase maturation protein
MQVVYFLVPLGLMVLIIAIWAFCWAVNSGQFNDMEQPAHQILFDDRESIEHGEKNDAN